MPPLLQVSNLSKRFITRRNWLGQPTTIVEAVHQVNLSIDAGETVGLVGESGCGKSTLGRCLLQLIRPTTGQVWLDGVELTALKLSQLRPMRRHMQMVFQNPYSSLNPRMRIGEVLTEPFIIHREGTASQQRERVVALLEQVGLPADSLSRYPHEFSGGQRQRIGIARALALRPKLIVADEPVSALDVSVQAQILHLLSQLKAQYGLTYLFIAHNLDVVRYLCDRVLVMYLGTVVESGPVRQVYHQPRHPYTQALLAAAPIANPLLARQVRASRTLIEGDPPNPAHPPSGCRFRTRCPYADTRCAQEEPLLRPIGPPLENQWVACHHAEQIPAMPDVPSAQSA